MVTIALLTDFGTQDVYVGVMKGVMRRISPEAQFVDISHAIPPQSIRAGALALRNSYTYFPEGTVFLVVIDPGVGSARRPIAVETGNYCFIAPDNGVLTPILQAADAFNAVELVNPEYRLSRLSATFHGRDVFAPAAAHVARGVALSELGPAAEDPVLLPPTPVTRTYGQITGEIVYIDHFGNFITNIGPLLWQADGQLLLDDRKFDPAAVRVTVGDTLLIGIKRAYHEVQSGALLAQVDSSGDLEIAVNQGNAAQRLGLAVGTKVRVEFTSA